MPRPATIARAQPAPRAGRRDIPALVIRDLLAREGVYGKARVNLAIAHVQARRMQGIATYGTPLQAHNGRNAGRDVLDEQCDAAQYALQKYEETENRRWWAIYERQLALWLDTLAETMREAGG